MVLETYTNRLDQAMSSQILLTVVWIVMMIGFIYLARLIIKALKTYIKRIEDRR